MPRIVVTGLGVVSPVGNNVPDAWENILAGKSGIGPIDTFDVSKFSSRMGGWCEFRCVVRLSPKEARKTDPFIHYGSPLPCEAIADAGLESTERTRNASVSPSAPAWVGCPGSRRVMRLMAGGPRKISPFLRAEQHHQHDRRATLSIRYGIKGPNFGIVTACSTGSHNIGDAGA